MSTEERAWTLEEVLAQLEASEEKARQEAFSALQAMVEEQPQRAVEAIPALCRLIAQAPGELFALQLCGQLSSLQQAQPQGFGQHLDAVLGSLTVLSALPLDDEQDQAGTIAQILLGSVWAQASQEQALLLQTLPVALGFLQKPHSVHQMAFSFVTTAAMQAPKALVDYIQPLLAALDASRASLLSALLQLYPHAPEAFEAHVATFFQLAQTDPHQKTLALQLMWEIAKRKPVLLLPYLDALKGGLEAPATAAILSQLYLEVARAHPQQMIPIVPALQEATTHNPGLFYVVSNIMGIIGQQSETAAAAMLSRLVALLGHADHNGVLVILPQLGHLALVDRSLLTPHLALVEEYAKAPEAAIRTQAQAILDVVAGRDLQSLAKQLEAHSEALKAATSSVEELRSYVDQHIEVLKEFLAQIAKRLPLPARFSTEGWLRKTLTLYFVCARGETRCLFPQDRPFTTETGDWNRWIKIAFSAVSAGKSVLAYGDTERAVDKVKACYEAYKAEDDDAFLSYIQQPFLTSKEEDALIEQLRGEKFFDTFAYDAQAGTWHCIMCGHRD